MREGLTFDPTLLERIPKEVLAAAQLVGKWFDDQGGTGSLCGIGPVWEYREVGHTHVMPDTPAYNMVIFHQRDIQAGTKIYVKG